MSPRLSFTEQRRHRLARRVAALEAMESRNMITESLWSLGPGAVIPMAMAAVGAMTAGSTQTPKKPFAGSLSSATNPALAQRRSGGDEGGSSGASVLPIMIAKPQASSESKSDDWLTLTRTQADPNQASALSLLAANSPSSAQSAGGGGAGGGGGGGGGSTRGQITPLQLAPPSANGNGSSSATSAMMTSALINANSSAASAVHAAPGAATVGTPKAAASAPVGPTAAGPTALAGSVSGGGVPTLAGGTPTPGLSLPIAGPSPGENPPLGIFNHYPLYTLDMNDGTVLFPGFVQLATGGENVDLRAQVRDTTVSTYSWDTTNLTGAHGISGASTFDLTFQWDSPHPTATTGSVTLTVTDTHSNTEIQTYTFYYPPSSNSNSGGANPPTWPTSLSPNTVLPAAPSFDSHNATVDANSGSLDTNINLPAYNSNVGALALTYDSITADPRPIITAPHALTSNPSTDSAALTFNSTVGTTYVYDASKLVSGDIQQIAQQADATALATGRYAYSLKIQDSGGSATTVTGNTDVINQSNNTSATDVFGSGWTLQGLEHITSVTGGVILDLGSGGRNLWFASAGSGGGYTSPPGEFSTLASSSGGNYTRTLTNGTKINFNSSGQETAIIDLNSLHITFTYSSGNLQTITDPYNNLTSFTYSGGFLRTITDPAGRVTTITHSGGSGGGNLTGVTLPDASSWSYVYDGSGRMTKETDPNSHTVTVVYDSANRVGTITRPDSTNETFVAYQERGWTNSGTVGSPANPALLAEARGSQTDPNSNTTDLRSDWWGLGLTTQETDPDGNSTTADRDTNSLATVAIDRLSRITTYVYDNKGNITNVGLPDGNVEQYTYNSFAEVTSFENARLLSTTYTYDNTTGNLTGVKDALNNLTTMTYTADGMLATSKDANGNTTSYAYDSQDRLTTIAYPGTGTPTQKYAYDSKGNVTSVTDENSHSTTFSFDAMNRETGMTDPLSNPTTLSYDSGGNLTLDQEPTPTGQTARTTTYAYDSMDRLTTTTAALSRVSVDGYDSGGRLITEKDPLGRITTIAYDHEDRPTVITSPLTALLNAVTTTTYDAEGEVIQVADPLNRITTTTYNSRGWVFTVKDPLGNVVTYSYTATGKPSAMTNPSGGGTDDAYTYDNDDRLIADQDGNGNITTFTYDGVGNRTAVTDPNNHTTSYLYDARNRVTTVTDALSHSTVYGYDSGGNQITVKDALGHTTTTQFDALNRATTITDNDGGVTTMAYDAAGRMTGLTDPNGNHTTWAYDAADRVTTITSPVSLSGVATTATTTFIYDSGGQLIDTTDNDGRRVTYSYDSGGRQINEFWVTSSGGTLRTVTYTYDVDGELTGAADPDSLLTFTYDSGGNQHTAATSGTGGQPLVTLTAGFDADHQRTSLSDSLSGTGGTGQGLTTYQYDPGHRLTTITQSFGGTNGPQVLFGYDAGNRLTSLARTIGGSGTAVNSAYSYDNADRTTTIIHQVGGGSVLATYIYAYDNANRLTTETNAEGTVTYSYDNNNELTAAGDSRTESYGYDSGGNRNTTGYTVPANSGNEETAAPGETYTYDAEGNLTGKTDTGISNTWAFTWDDRNRLTGVTEKNSGGSVIMQATYTYDALNRRIGTDVDDDGSGPHSPVQTWFVYDGQKSYGDFNGSGAVQRRYLYGPAVDEILARTDSGGTSAWYLTNRLGSVGDIANTSGSVIDHVTYDSYGRVTSETNATNGDRFKFDGMQNDTSTGLYFDKARYYDPTAGRFISRDPISFEGGDSDLYRFVEDQPTNLVDSSGLYYDEPQSENPIKYDPSTLGYSIGIGLGIPDGGAAEWIRQAFVNSLTQQQKSREQQAAASPPTEQGRKTNSPPPTNQGPGFPLPAAKGQEEAAHRIEVDQQRKGEILMMRSMIADIKDYEALAKEAEAMGLKSTAEYAKKRAKETRESLERYSQQKMNPPPVNYPQKTTAQPPQTSPPPQRGPKGPAKPSVPRKKQPNPVRGPARRAI
jgi:RHS repeat-associated protein